MMRASARDFLLNECSKTKVRELEESDRGYDPEMWKKMADLGWMGLVFPEEYNGTEGEFLDLTVLLEEMGRNILPFPFFSTVVLCSLPILQFGTKEQKKRFLPRVASGDLILALALTEPSATYKPSGVEVKATLKDGSYVVDGTKLFVNDAHIANYLLVVTRTTEGENPEEGITLFLVEAKSPGIKVEVIPTTASDKQCEVVFEGVKVSLDNILGEVDKGWEIVEWILQRAAVCKCAEVVGGCEAVLEMASSYAKDRVQFDRPIGSFQIIQHKLADMMIGVEKARYISYEAAWKLNMNFDAKLEISMAKAVVSETYQRACLDGIEIHGAIGFTQDHDIGLYFRRAGPAEVAFGDADFHRERVAQELGL
jgi:alkylation response protein AidB-like acyl-CoA dehydrogenase